MPTFSVVTPSLNQGQYLPECLASVREAGRRAGVAVQHLVMDGGSRDGTVGILERATGIEWESGPDGGQTDAINKGLARVTGEYVSYLCADDVLEPEAFALVAAAFARVREASVVYGDGYFLECGWRRRKFAGEFSVERLRRVNFLLQPAVFWRRSVHEAFGPLDAGLRYCMDHEYWLRICRGTVWEYVAEPLAVCRLHADAKTWKQMVPAWDEARRMQARYGIYWRPARDALWMRLAGAHFYRLKRVLIALWAGRRAG